MPPIGRFCPVHSDRSVEHAALHAQCLCVRVRVCTCARAPNVKSFIGDYHNTTQNRSRLLMISDVRTRVNVHANARFFMHLIVVLDLETRWVSYSRTIFFSVFRFPLAPRVVVVFSLYARLVVHR